MGVKTLITYNFGEEKMEGLRKLGCDLIYIPEKEVAYSEELRDVEVIIGYDPFATLDISKMKKLKWIQLFSAGIDQLPTGYLKDKDIIITNNKGYSIPIGEWIVMDILELLKHSSRFMRSQDRKQWKLDRGILEVYGKTIGFIGTGAIAQEAAKRLQGFEARVVGLNTRGLEVQYFHECFRADQLDEMLSQADIVVVTIPYTDSSFHLIDAGRIRNMKDGACFINIARGSIVDEAALINALESGKIAGAALDVFEEEPLSPASPFWEMDNVIVTPHNAFISDMKDERRYETIHGNMKNFMDGKELRNVIDLKRGY
ncbi:MAG: D-isomer specific 2-hydroxyacid dehydrogenase [Firmicutes bacterium]|nr:D-isomer specific 2-hydroxyacid dehydrogenase [Bacillota bacterium]